MIPVLSVVGASDSGKTTLLEDLIPQFKNKGFRVGSLKHASHGFEIDHPGKDSYRLKKAGADIVAVVSPQRRVIIEDHSDAPNSEYMVNRYFSDVDIVLVEGFKGDQNPKIEVFKNRELLCAESNQLLAIVNNSETERVISQTPSFKMAETEKIVDFIIEMLLPEGNKPKKSLGGE